MPTARALRDNQRSRPRHPPIMLHPKPPHVFAGNPIDRGEVVRRDAAALAELASSAATSVLVLHRLNPLVASDGIAWLDVDAASRLCGTDEVGTPLVAWGVEGELTSELPTGAEFMDARAGGEALTRREAGILAQAKANLDWHARHRFCARCGAETAMQRGGQTRRCTSCRAEHFPRTDPVVITVATHGDRCLLGQSAGRLRSMRMYSALAGFMDQGESMEDAVRREVMEEAGIEIGRVAYHSSQPWPFPSSLMIGSHSEALTTDIDIDDFEMTDVQWFTREEVLRALAGEHDGLRVPGPIAIAHHLIRAWATGEAGDFSR